MNIRKASPHDQPAVLRLFHFLSDQYQDRPDAFEKALRTENTEVYILEVDGQVIGTATFSWRAVPSVGIVGYIDDVVVDPRHRGHGFGEALSQFCLELAGERQMAKVELTSHPSRVAANALYQKMGFTKRETNVYVFHLKS